MFVNLSEYCIDTRTSEVSNPILKNRMKDFNYGQTLEFDVKK